MAKVRLIKRYTNRKMYDTERSCYVTLTEVAELVRAGEDVQVIDNKTKADLTEVTLTQALLDSERRRRGSVSLDGIRELIAQGGDLLSKRVSEPVGRFRQDAERTIRGWQSEAERNVDRVLHRRDGAGAATAGTAEGDARSTDAQPPAAPTTEAEPGPDAAPARADTRALLDALMEQTQRFYEEMQHRFEDRVRQVASDAAPHGRGKGGEAPDAVGSGSPTAGAPPADPSDVEALRADVDALATTLGDIRAEQQALRATLDALIARVDADNAADR
jgi:polyhydroxyalkanoate synthesis repressor PhaR